VTSPSTTYEPRQPAAGVLYQVVRDHFETFRAQAADLRDGEGLPGFVEQEFHKFLRCGSLGGGFARFRCTGCGFDRLVPFSCKGRGFCPSCGGRRMAERAAHLVDNVFPRVPVRQWMLSLPCRLRYRLAWDHALCRAVVGRTMRAILGFLRRRAREDGVMDGRSGAVVIVQRFGGALNLNVHFHALVLDGVFARNGDTLRFHPCPPLDAADVEEVLATVTAHIGRLLAHGGSGDGDDDGLLDEWADEAPVLAGLAAASVQGRVALGSRAGARVRRRGDSWASATDPSGLGPDYPTPLMSIWAISQSAPSLRNSNVAGPSACAVPPAFLRAEKESWVSTVAVSPLITGGCRISSTSYIEKLSIASSMARGGTFG
jgi:hypothetical protein